MIKNNKKMGIKNFYYFLKFSLKKLLIVKLIIALINDLENYKRFKFFPYLPFGVTRMIFYLKVILPIKNKLKHKNKKLRIETLYITCVEFVQCYNKNK
jgi:hypothetical protein